MRERDDDDDALRPADCQRESPVLALPDLPTTNQQQSDRSPDTILTEKAENYPGFGPDDKPIWMRVG